MKKLFRITLLLLFFGLLILLTKQVIKTEPDENIVEPQVELYLHQKNTTISLDLEDYIIGTVAAEMPASFPMEALKAQAVCARTYALKKLIEKHPYPQGADLSDDINSCQAFRNVYTSDSIDKESLKKVEEAVKSTRGEIMLYNSQPIDALYHSTCGGKTESSPGNQVPYLQSVKCNYCCESPHYSENWKFNNEVIKALVGDHSQKLSLKAIAYTSSGRINQFSINGKKIYAAQVRQELGLPSQWISFDVNKKQTEINTRGYGHGMGLCQYGANGMAKKGKSYHQILEHYYHDIQYYQITY